MGSVQIVQVPKQQKIVTSLQACTSRRWTALPSLFSILHALLPKGLPGSNLGDFSLDVQHRAHFWHCTSPWLGNAAHQQS